MDQKRTNYAFWREGKLMVCFAASYLLACSMRASCSLGALADTVQVRVSSSMTAGIAKYLFYLEQPWYQTQPSRLLASQQATSLAGGALFASFPPQPDPSRQWRLIWLLAPAP